jgi:hypothetical protein
MPRTVRTIVMTRKLTIGPLGPCCNEHNYIDECLLSVGEYPLHHCLFIPSTVTQRTLLQMLAEPTRELIATTLCLLISTLVPLL